MALLWAPGGAGVGSSGGCRARAARLGDDAGEPRQRARDTGTGDGGTARLEQAVAPYRAAQQERTRERAPLDWAMTKANLALALTALAERTGQSRAAALAEIDTAVEVFRAAGATEYVSLAEAIRARIQAHARA